MGRGAVADGMCRRESQSWWYATSDRDGVRHFLEFGNLVEVHVAIDVGGFGCQRLHVLQILRQRRDALFEAQLCI